MQRLFQTSIFRITLLYLLLLGVTLTLVLGFVYWQTAGLLERQTDETVRAEMAGIRNDLAAPADVTPPKLERALRRSRRRA